MHHCCYGAFLNAPGDIPGSIVSNAILVSIGLTMVITAIILFSKPFLPLLLVHLQLLRLLCRCFRLWF
jgi:hypothetical protein